LDWVDYYLRPSFEHAMQHLIRMTKKSYSKRTNAWEMFGVDFTPEVVQADGNVRKLAWRICNAKRVLAPFSMNTTSASSPKSSPPATPKLGPVKM